LSANNLLIVTNTSSFETKLFSLILLFKDEILNCPGQIKEFSNNSQYIDSNIIQLSLLLFTISLLSCDGIIKILDSDKLMNIDLIRG